MTRIIVVEQDRLLRHALVTYLKRQGYQVLEAALAALALERLECESADAIVLGAFSETEGAEVLRQIRTQLDLAQVPIVAIVAANCSSEMLDYLEPGDYVRIPFDMPFLDWVLKELLAKYPKLERDSHKL